MKKKFASFLTSIADADSTYASPTQDILFEADYVHQNPEKDCKEGCDLQKLKNRSPPLPRQFPEIHVGTIASGNSVVKDATLRQAMYEYYKKQNRELLAIEMESAGVATAAHHLGKHYLFIRGICDYADSHKNKKWQEYAAATAASFAVLLIENLPKDTSK
jgi:nucleoside phosphorylase